MRFKTHCPDIGDLDFAVHDSEEALIAAIRQHIPGRAWRARLSILIEDSTTKSGWTPLASSFWRVDGPEGSEDTVFADDVTAPTERGWPVRWMLVVEDDRLDYLLCEVFAWVGAGPVINMSA